jgi:hypothetical protein
MIEYNNNDNDIVIDDDDDEDLDVWGFFNEDDEKIDNKTIRRTWLDKFSRDKSKSPSKMYSKYNSVNRILFKWSNLNPSLSIKLSSKEVDFMNSLNISVCIAGYRLVQLSSGEIKAEFHLLFCYGSVSYSSWKTFSEFNELAKIIKQIHSTGILIIVIIIIIIF